METLNQQKAELETALADPVLYDAEQKNQLKELLLRQGNVGRELEQLEQQWFELQQALEDASIEN